jgi:putative ABC transport system permease protein
MMRRRFRRLFRHTPDRPDQLAREIDDEIASHVAARVEQLERLGMLPDQARAEALKRFGDVGVAHGDMALSARRRGALIRARERADALKAMLSGVPRDARFAARTLSRNPTFAVATVATLGLVIAAAVTAFSFVDALFLRPLPAPSANRLVRVYLPRSNGRLTQVGSSGAELLRARSDVFEQVAAERCCWVKFVSERGTLDQRYAAFASSEFFPLLGITPALGRFFLPSETAHDGADPVAVVSYSLWQRRFNGDVRVVGEHVRISNVDFTVIGVAPPGFVGVSVGAAPTEIWLPSTMKAAVGLGCEPAIPCNDMDILARLAPGVSAARATAGLSNLGSALSHVAIGDDSVRRPAVLAASGALLPTQRELAPLAKLLGAIAALLLIIGCANLTGLLVVRGVSRAREVALRLSLGASRVRMVQQLLVESGAVAIAGGAFGVLLSIAASRALMGFFVTDSEGFQSYFPIGLDARVLWFALGVSVLSVAGFGLLPALVSARAQPAEVLKSGASGGRRGRARFELVTVQAALTAALLSGAVLLSRSFTHLLHAQRFDTDHVALLRVRPAAAGYDSTRAEQYVHAVADRLAALPGVEQVAFARGAGFAWKNTPLDVGVGLAMGDSATQGNAQFVSPSFFRTLQIGIIQGREFTDADGPRAPLVAMVSEPLARQLAGVGSRAPMPHVLGRTLYVHGRAFRIVGVVPDYLVHMQGEATPPMIFFAFWQNALGPEGDARFVVRVSGDAGRALATLRTTAQAVDRAVPVAEVMTLAAQVDASYPQIRLGQNVALAAGSIALVLSAIGLYGVVAFLVTQRTREIGLRIALGALPSRVALRLVYTGMTAAATGVIMGLGIAWMLGRLLSAWLVGVSPHDGVALVGAAAAVLLASLVACAIPARRASTIDPVRALKVE